MAERTFYVEDTVALKTNKSTIGQVDRTHGDVTSHVPNPIVTSVAGIKKSKRIPKDAFNSFLVSGVPPRGTVLITWFYFPGQNYKTSWLMTTEELVLVDRSLIAGDVVKRDAEDAMSGTVVHSQTVATLFRPRQWPAAVAGTVQYDDQAHFGNYDTSQKELLKDVPTEDLVLANRYEVGDFVIYKDWIGRIMNKWEDFYLRLSNNSVVVPEDPEDLRISSLGDQFGANPAVGDFAATKKSNIRRGRWIYGAYNANIDPSGYIADIRTTSLEVHWLSSKLSNLDDKETPEPNDIVDQDMLETGEFKQYDRRRMSYDQDRRVDANSNRNIALRKLDLDVLAGEAVRFKDLAGAAVKYDGSNTYGKLERIPRKSALGYDINVYKVATTSTLVTVLWQDRATSVLPSNQLVPYLEPGQDDSVWPGELIATRKTIINEDIAQEPQNIGIVQSVNAKDRTARVKWFPYGSISFVQEPEETYILPGHSTGPLSDNIDEVSLYDIWSMPGLSRGIGDYVIIHPFGGRLKDNVQWDVYDMIDELIEPYDPVDWFGQIVGLGLDGLIHVRLAASSHVREVRIPWECAVLIHSTDMEDETEPDSDDMDDESDEDDDTSIDLEMEEDSDEDMPELIEIQDANGQWRSLAEGEDVDGAVNGWETEDETEEISEDDNADSNSDTEMEDNDIVEMDDPPAEPVEAPHTHRKPLQQPHFSYGTMFDGTLAANKPGQFIILDTQPPADHHYSNRTPVNNTARLKRIQREYRILQNSLPDGVYVRTWESALDLLRVLILGPVDTPYEYAPFVIDFHLDSNYPYHPPQAFFHSWTNGAGPINPNLYEDGKICLSLLGTWPGSGKNETWSAEKSTLLQLLVSLLGLVLVKEPFFNEAGYEARAGTAESRIPSAIYTERTYFNSRGFILHALQHPVQGFEQEIISLYLGSQQSGGPRLLYKAASEAVETIRRSKQAARKGAAEGTSDGGRTVSIGALIPLRRHVDALLGFLQDYDRIGAREIRDVFALVG